MIKKVLIILAVINLAGFINSCCTVETHYTWLGISDEILDNSGKVPLISDLDSINKMAYGVRLQLKDSVFYYAAAPQAYNSLNAFICGRKYINHSYIVNISVKTLYDFDDMKAKGAEITDYFVARNYEDTESDYTLLTDFTDDVNNFAYQNGEIINIFDIFLMHQPVLSDTCQFKIELALSDSNTISCVTRKIKLY